MRQGRKMEPTMELDGFLYGTGFLSDGASDSQSEISDMTFVDDRRNTPRKFGTDLTERNVNTSSSKRLSSRFTKKQSSIIKHPRNRSRLQLNNISPRSKVSPTIKSRFSSKERSYLGKNLAFSLEMAEKSVNSALNIGSTERSKTPNSTNVTKSMWSSPIGQSSSPRAQEYSVYFKPGPIGLKLEPVIKNGNKEFGCRVMKFTAEKSKISSSPSQAVKCGLIQLGDVLTAINSIAVTSKPYAEIISILTKFNDKGRTLTFRWRSPAPVMPVTPGRSHIDNPGSPALTKDILKSPEMLQQTKTPVALKETISTRLDFHQGESQNLVLFSPSSVQKFSKTHNLKSSSDLSADEDDDKHKSGFLNSVMKRVFPEMYGSELEETAEKKFQLLSELSDIKEALTGDELVSHNNSPQRQEMASAAKNERKQETIALRLDNINEKSHISHEKENEKRVDDIADENTRLKAECAYLKEIARRAGNGYSQDMNRFKSVLSFQSEATDILRLENERLDTLLKEQNEKFDDLYADKISAEHKLSSLSSSMKEKDAKMKEAKALIEDLRLDLSHSKEISCKRIAELEHSLQNSSTEIIDQSSKIEELKFQLESLQTSYNKSCDLITSLNEDIKNERTANAHLRDSLIDERDALKTQLEESKHIIAATTSGFNEKLNSAMSDVEARKNTEKQLIKQVSERESKFLGQIESLQRQLNEKSSMLQTTEENFIKIQDLLFSTTEELKQVKFDYESTLKQLNGTSIEKEELLNQLQKSESQSHEYQEISRLGSLEKNNLKEQLQICEQNIAQLTDSNVSLRTENEDLKGHLQNKVSELQLLKVKLEELHERNTVLQQRHDLVCSDLKGKTVLSVQLEQSDDLVKELKDSSASLQKRCDELTLDIKEKETLIMTLQTAENEKKHLEKVYQDLQLQHNLVLSESQSLRHSLAETQRTANKREQHLREEIEKKQLAFSQRESELEMDIEESKLFIHNLMGQLKSGSKESSDLYEKKLSSMTTKLASMEEAMAKIKEKHLKTCHEKEQRIAKLTEELSSMESIVTTLKDDKKELTSIIAFIEESKKLLSQSLQDQTERAAKLESESFRLKSLEEEKCLLSKTVHERESEIEALNMELSSLRERTESRDKDISSLEDRMSSNDSDYRTQLVYFQNKLDRLALERNEALHSLHASQLQIELQYKTIEQLETSISHKKENDGGLMATVLQLEEKLRKANMENQKKINLFKVEDKDKANLIETLKNEVKLKEQLIDTICNERDLFMKGKDELQNALENEKNALKSKESELQDALARDEKINEELNHLRSKLQDSRCEVSELENALKDTESNCRSLTSSTNNLYDKVLQLQEHLQSSRSEVTELRSRLSEKEFKYKTLESVVADLQRRENESQDKLTKLETQLQASQNGCKKLERSLEMKSIEYKDAEDQLHHIKAQHDELSARNEKLEAQIDDYRFEISELEKVLDENNEELEAFRFRENDLQEKMRNLDSQLETARSDFNDLRMHFDQNNLTVKSELEHEIENLKHSLTVITKEKTSINNTLNEKNISFKELSISHQALMTENAELLQSISCFESDLLHKANEVEQLQQAIAHQQDEARRISSEHNNMLDSLKDSKEYTLRLETELHTVKSAVEEERQKAIAAADSNQILKESNESKKREIDDLLDTIEQFEVHVYELKESNESKQQEIDDLLDTVEQLDVHIQELTKAYDMLKDTSQTEADAAKIKFELEQKRSHQEFEEMKKTLQAQISSTTDELNAALSKIQSLKDHSFKLETKLKDTETALNLQKENTDTLETLSKEIEKSCLDLYLIDENKQPASTLECLSLLKNAVVDYKANALAGFETANTRESAINRLERKLEAKEKDLVTIKNDNQSLIDKLREVKEDLKGQLSLISIKDDIIKELESNMAQLELDFDTSEELLEELRSEKEELLNHCNMLEKDSEVLTKSIKSANDTISELEQKLVDDHRIHNSLLEEKNSHIERLQYDLDTVSAEADKLICLKEELQTEILQSKQSYSQLESESQENLIAVQEELRDQIRRNDELHEDNCILLSKLEDSIKSLEDLKKCMTLDDEEFSASILQRETEIVELKKTISIMEDDATLKAKRVSELQNNERELNDEISKLSKLIQEVEESKEAKNSASNAEIDALKKQIQSLESSIDTLLTDTSHKDTEIYALNATVSRMEGEIEEKKSSIDFITKSRDSEVETLQKQIDSLHIAIRESQVEIQDQEFERRLLQDSISSLQSELQMKTNEMTTFSQKYDADVTSLQQQIDDKSSQLLSLSQKFDLMEKISQELKSELDEALSKQQEFQTANADIDEAMQKATRLLKIRDNTIMELQTEVKHLEQKMEDLVSLPAKLEAKDIIISKVSLEAQDFRAQYEGLQKEIERLTTALSSKDMDITSLKEWTTKLENDLKSAEITVLKNTPKENSTEEYLIKIRQLEDSYQDVSARLQGAEKIASIDNKECTRLLNEIDSKSEEISDLIQQLNSVKTERDNYVSRLSEIESNMRTQKDLLSQMEKEREENLSRYSELESRFDSQKDRFVRLEKELQHKDEQIVKLEKLHASRTPSNVKIVELEEELDRCNAQIYDLQAEVNQAHDECAELRSAMEKANAESATSEEEVQLLCESIEEKERLLNSLRLQLSSFAEEKQELQSHLNTIQIHLDKDSFSPLSINSFGPKDVDEGKASEFFSPSNSEVLSKHNELLDDLHRMKSLIKDAISTPLSNGSDPLTPTNQNRLLSSMEEQVDVLLKDIADLKRNLSEKERLIHDLTISLKRSEREKKEIETKLQNRKNYIKQLENALSHEVKHRRAAEEALLSTETEKGNLILENEKQSEELQSAKLEIQSKSDAVQEQMKVARQMAKQLQITKKKIFALKKHLIENGLIVPPEDIVSPTIENSRTCNNSEPNYSPIVTNLETRLDTVLPTTPPNDYSPIVTDENSRAKANEKTPIASNYTFSPIWTKTDISNDSLNWDALSSEDDEETSF